MAFLSDAKIVRSPFPEKDKNRAVCHISVTSARCITNGKMSGGALSKRGFFENDENFLLNCPSHRRIAIL